MNPFEFKVTDAFIKKLQRRLHVNAQKEKYLVKPLGNLRQVSSVLFLLGDNCGRAQGIASPCVVMNMRSALVRQAGDLCCPGGGLSLLADGLIARLLELPFSALNRWPYWSWWRKYFSFVTKQMALCYAAALREGVEEMRLNPFGLTFLGPLPTQHLTMFKRTIYPQVVWINRQRRFFPNWEVERIVYLPLQELLNPANYARYRLQMRFCEPRQSASSYDTDLLCYTHRHGNGSDILWGATFRITMDFLRIIFGFQPPDPHRLRVIRRRIDDNYLNSFGPK